MKTWALALLVALPAAAGEIAPADRRSGFDFMGRENQAMQQDDAANPGMLWVQDGAALWRDRPTPSAPSCAECHGETAETMRGVAARYPAFDAASGRPVDLAERINLCRAERQQASPLPAESQPLLGLTAFVAHQSRGQPIAPPEDPRLASYRARGEALYRQRMGQLDFACAQCHDDNWGKRLAGSVIPQAHPTGYPLYRLEWQGLGSLQRRIRGCLTGVRAEPFPPGAAEYVELELYLMWRARGLPLETPAVRP